MHRVSSQHSHRVRPPLRISSIFLRFRINEKTNLCLFLFAPLAVLLFSLLAVRRLVACPRSQDTETELCAHVLLLYGKWNRFRVVAHFFLLLFCCLLSVHSILSSAFDRSGKTPNVCTHDARKHLQSHCAMCVASNESERDKHSEHWNE